MRQYSRYLAEASPLLRSRLTCGGAFALNARVDASARVNDSPAQRGAKMRKTGAEKAELVEGRRFDTRRAEDGAFMEPRGCNP